MIKISVLCSGSKGNATYLEINNSKILVDVGYSERYISKSLKQLGVKLNEITHVFITHTHTDHVSALDKIIKKSHAKVYITDTMLNELDYLNNYDNIEELEKEIIFDDIVITPISSSHDKPDSKNFIIEYNNKKVVYITDTGYIHSKYFKLLKDADVYLIESNHDEEMLINGPYPEWLQQRVLSDEGHLSNTQAGFYLSKFITNKTKEVILLHLSEKNNTPDKALSTVKDHLLNNDIIFDKIVCSKQDDITNVILE